MKRREWIIGVIMALAAVAAALGYSTPSSRLKQSEAKIEKLETHLAGHDVHFATIDTKLDYMSDGIDELLGRRHRRPR